MTQFDPNASNSYGADDGPDQQHIAEQQAADTGQPTQPINGQTQLPGQPAQQQPAVAAPPNRADFDKRQAYYNAIAGDPNRQRQQANRYNFGTGPTAPNPSQSVPNAGQAPSGLRGPYGNRPKPQILLDHPDLSDDVLSLLERKRQNRLPDREAEANPDLMSYYQFMAKIDPSSATYDPPETTYMPMPDGGLDAIVTHHLGPRPGFTRAVTDYAPDEVNQILTEQAQYDADAATYRHLLFTLNRDHLRNETRYVRAAPVRVPTQFGSSS